MQKIYQIKVELPINFLGSARMNSVPTLYSGVCWVFLYLVKYVGTDRKPKDFTKL